MSLRLCSASYWTAATLAAGVLLTTVPQIPELSPFSSLARAAGLGGVGGAVGGAGSAVGGAVGSAGGAVGGVGSAIGGAGNAVGGAVGSAGGAVGGAGSAVGGAVGSAGGAVGGVGSTVGGAGNAVGGAVGSAGGAVGGAGSAVGGAVGGAGNAGVGTAVGGAVGPGGPGASPGGAGPITSGASGSSSRSASVSTAGAVGRAKLRKKRILFLRHGNGGERGSSAARRLLNPTALAPSAVTLLPGRAVKRRLVRQQEARLQIASIAPVRLGGSGEAARASEAYREGVVLASGLTASELKALVAQKFSLLDIVDAQNTLYKLGVPPGMSTPAALEVVRKVSPLIVADLDHIYTLVDSHNICSRTACQPFQAGGWLPPRPALCGALPTIGMIDTAIDPHSTLFASAKIVALGEASTGANNSHGTHVASLLAAGTETKVPGLLPTARLIVYNAFSSKSDPDVTDAVSVVRAISSLVRADAKVINMSLAGPPNLLLEQAVEGALEQNIVIVAAAGNGGPGPKAAFPAAYDGVIAVTAVDDELKGYEHAARGSYIALAASGVRLLTVDSRSKSDLISGTSYAAPFVTAAAALLVAAQPKLSPKQVAGALIAAARDGPLGRDNTFGWGLLRFSNLCQASDKQNADRITHAPIDARR
jgi:hypothetical protein